MEKESGKLTEEQLSEVSGGENSNSLNENCYFMPTGEVEYRNDNTEKWIKCSSHCGNITGFAVCACYKKYWCKNKWHMVYIAGGDKDYLVEKGQTNHASKKPMNGYDT